MKPKLKKVKSLAELKQLAGANERYAALLMIGARNLGGRVSDLAGALQ